MNLERSKNTMNKETICFDFDGVLHSYTSGWKGVNIIPDEPVDIELMKVELEKLKVNYDLVIYSTRAETDDGIKAIWNWLDKYGLSSYFSEIYSTKPSAKCYIDDRAITFNGLWDGISNRILNFKTWQGRK